MSGPVNPAFYSFFVKAKAFRVGDGCTGCGRCAKLCPMNNITLRSVSGLGRPLHPLHACICYCPAEAIEYGRKSVGQPRYHFEAL